jgi:hypothetical protein
MGQIRVPKSKEMGIKVESVYRQKSALLKEIQRLIEEGLL